MKRTFALAEVKAFGEGDSPGEFEAILSAPTLDRDGEVIDPGAFNPLPDHISIDVDHGLSTMTTVGSGQPFYDGDLLKVRGTFSSIPRAQEVRTLVAEGHVTTMSVAFMGQKRSMKDGIPHITRAELLNAAFVPVPSNREAAVLVAKGLAGKDGARNSAADQGHLDAAHDHLVAAGASCTSDMKGVRGVGGKALVGSFEERTEELEEALEAVYVDAWWVRIVATFDDTVVYQVYGGTSAGDQYQASYTIADDGSYTIGEANPVEVVEVIADAGKQFVVRSAQQSDPVDPEPSAAAEAAADVPADAEIEIELLQRMVDIGAI